MRKLFIPIVLLSVCGSCKKEIRIKEIQAKRSPSPLRNLTGNWHQINDTTTQIGGIMGGSQTTGINYLGKAGDYYNFTPGKLSFHDNNVTGVENFKLDHDTVFVEYAYFNAPTNQVDSAYDPAFVVTHLTDHNCTMTENNVGFEINSFSIINLSG